MIDNAHTEENVDVTASEIGSNYTWRDKRNRVFIDDSHE